MQANTNTTATRENDGEEIEWTGLGQNNVEITTTRKEFHEQKCSVNNQTIETPLI